jgi:hypothetical protein
MCNSDITVKILEKAIIDSESLGKKQLKPSLLKVIRNNLSSRPRVAINPANSLVGYESTRQIVMTELRAEMERHDNENPAAIELAPYADLVPANRDNSMANSSRATQD